MPEIKTTVIPFSTRFGGDPLATLARTEQSDMSQTADGIATFDETAARASMGVTRNLSPYLIGVVAALIALRYANEKASDGSPDPEFVGINLFNFAAIGLQAMLFVLLGKVLFTKMKVPGITELFAAA